MGGKNKEYPKWFRNRGYLHLIGKPVVRMKGSDDLLNKIKSDKDFIAKHAFLPLIHTTIIERRYKRIESEKPARAHSFFKDEIVKHQAKSRPIHYASHTDALIFGWYSEILKERYEQLLQQESYKDLYHCIIGYRRLPIEDPYDRPVKKNGEIRCKGTAHFAFEAFEEIKKRAAQNGCAVLKFDIETFFSSIDHKKLLKAWAEILLGNKELPLPKDHYTVFKAATRMHFVLLDDLRAYQTKNERKAGFDEKKLANIRKSGVESFFLSVQELRRAIKERELRIYKAPFTKPSKADGKEGKKWYPKGIPQGLPISATLANIYLLDFDRAILEHLVRDKGCYYRRYSDDLIIICEPEEAAEVKEFILREIEGSAVKISGDKTEEFLFKTLPFKVGKERLTSIRKMTSRCPVIDYPFSFLGFEFYGYQTLIKSAKLARFYRRMIESVKRKSKRALKIAEAAQETPVLFHNQLRRLYLDSNLRKSKITRKWKQLRADQFGVYSYIVKAERRAIRSNYLTYAQRSDKILHAKGKIERQLKKHKLIYRQAVHRHFIQPQISKDAL